MVSKLENFEKQRMREIENRQRKVRRGNQVSNDLATTTRMRSKAGATILKLKLAFTQQYQSESEANM